MGDVDILVSVALLRSNPLCSVLLRRALLISNFIAFWTSVFFSLFPAGCILLSSADALASAHLVPGI